MIRAFLAVEVKDDLRKQIAQVQQDLKQRLSREAPREVRISWVHPTSIHLTIKFLGDIDEQLVDPMRAAIGQVLREHRAIQIPLERLGAFPRPQQPRVLWIGASEQWEQREDGKRLEGFHRAIEDCCATFDFAPEGRPLSPHLTLARIKEGERHIGQALAKSGVMDRSLTLTSLAIESVVLMKSELRPTGSVYTKLWEIALAHP
ncbi:MAG TPA: RNA 2',3'-cyclic phosphodiesterase [Nitrospiraceae bacterium]